jgi:hypothetical protein
MAYEQIIGRHSYIFDVDYGEEAEAARIIVRSDTAGTEGLFLVDADGEIEQGADIDGFGPNPLTDDSHWPEPPKEAVADAQRIAAHKDPND